VKSNVGEIKIVAQAVQRAITNASGIKSTTNNPRRNLPHEIQSMTDIQIETLRMVAQGHTNSEIAKQRFVSDKAVEQTIAKIAKALDIPAATNQNQRVHIARVYFRLTGQRNI
jgi:DNA-binding NarL/FixJ family response regulator